MTKRPTAVLAITSDQHCGSRVSLCPPEGVPLPDGNWFMPSKGQIWAWECWLDFHEQVRKARIENKANLYYIQNGDAFEGDHHGVHQIISRDSEAQSYVADKVFDVVRKLKPKKVWVVRGTRSHVGSNEEYQARFLGAVREEETGMYARYWLRVNIHGLIIDAQHHGKMGRLPRTERSNMILNAYSILDEYAGRGLTPPNLVIRSHLHKYGDSGRDHRKFVPRILAMPSFKLKDDFAHKVATDSLADIGGVIITIWPDGEYEVKPVLYQPALPAIERA